MNYSLLDAFLVWLGPWGTVGLIVGFFGIVIGLSHKMERWICSRQTKQIRYIDHQRSVKSSRKIMVQYAEVFKALAESERKEAIHETCRENSTRRRYSKSTLTKTRK